MISKEDYLIRHRVGVFAKGCRIFVRGLYSNAVCFEVSEELYRKLQAEPLKSDNLRENLEDIEDVFDILTDNKPSQVSTNNKNLKSLILSCY